VLDSLLRLLHPIVPFVTEELWTTLTGERTLVRAAWPTVDESRENDAAEKEVASLQSVVTEVRRFRADQGVKPSQRVVARLDGLDSAGLTAHEGLIRSLARLDEAGGDFGATAKLSVGVGVTVELDTRGAIDVAAERARLAKDRAAAEKEVAQCRAKLGNPAFTDKAPEQVVTKIRQRLAAAEADLARIAAQLDSL
jgi:valyl-tRNA synthetase